MAYEPPWFLKNGTVQTMLAPLRRGIPESHPALLSEDIEFLVSDSRLHAFYSRNLHERALVVLIHGWEGRASASYMDRTAVALFDAGFSVARLHLKDHGHTRSWNPDLFNGSMLAEHFEAVRRIAGKRRVYLAGFSLGGNFALRIAAKGARGKIPGLGGVVSISAPLDPHKATASMDRHPLIGRYLLRQWRASLREKEEHFPANYDFGKHRGIRSIMDLTDALIQEYSDFSSLEEYFGTYTLDSHFFKRIDVPFAMLSSRDDPVIPPEEYEALRLPANGELELSKSGGHVAFVQPGDDPYYVEFIRSRILRWEEPEKPAPSKKRVKRAVKKVRQGVHSNGKKPAAFRGKHRK